MVTYPLKSQSADLVQELELVVGLKMVNWTAPSIILTREGQHAATAIPVDILWARNATNLCFTTTTTATRMECSDELQAVSSQPILTSSRNQIKKSRMRMATSPLEVPLIVCLVERSLAVCSVEYGLLRVREIRPITLS